MAFGAVSCQKDDENFAANNGGNSPSLEISDLKNGEVAFVVSGEGAKSLQKAHYKSDDDHTILWDGTEEFSVFPVGKTTNEKFATSLEYAGMESCVIKGSPAETSDAYFALYPYSSSAKYADGKFVNVTMPSVQNVSAGQYDTKADVLVGYSSSIDFKMTFRHVGAKLGIKVPAEAGDVKSIKIDCTEPIAGIASVLLDANADALPSATVTSGSKSIVMKSESGFEADKTYYVCVLPTSKESTMKVTFFTNDDQTAGKYSSATVPAIVRNTKISAAPLAKNEIIVVKLSDLNLSTNFPKTATKIVFDYLDNVDVSAFGEPVLLKDGAIKLYKVVSQYYILSNKEICMSGSLEKMFYSYSRLKEIEFNNFNTENVVNMNNMFYDCRALTSLDVSNFNTANVTNMNYMFFDCPRLTSLDVSNFNTGGVVGMHRMFLSCSNLITIYANDNFNTSNVTSSYDMFTDCSRLKGGNETTYNSSCTDVTYARVDDPDNGKPGYFTYKAPSAK